MKQVAERLGISIKTVWRWKSEHRFPAAVRLGPGMTRWRLADIEAWEAKLVTCFMSDALDLV